MNWMRSGTLPALMLALGLATAAGSLNAATPINIDGTEYYRLSSTPEILEASEADTSYAFGDSIRDSAELAQVITASNYSGFVEVIVTGTGFSLSTRRNDAFYVYTNTSGGDTPPFNNARSYQLAIDTDDIIGRGDFDNDPPRVFTPEAQLARNLIVYDYDAGEGGQEVTPRYIPEYNSDHRYHFVIDLSQTRAWTESTTESPIHFANADDIFNDNGGKYRFEVYQLTDAPLGDAILLQAADQSVPSVATRAAVQVNGPVGGTIPDVEILVAEACIDGELQLPESLGVLSNPVNQLPVPGGSSGAIGEREFDADGIALIIDDRLPARDADQRYAAARLVSGPASGSLSNCVVAGPDNDVWTRAQRIEFDATGVASFGAGDPFVSGNGTGFIDIPNRVRWFKFSVNPNDSIVVELRDLTEDYDIVVFKDIAQAFTALADGTDVEGLDRLGAEFAPSNLNTTEISPFAFSPAEISPFAFSPFAFSPFAFSSSVYAGETVAPFAFSPFAYSGARNDPAIAPFAFSPFAFSPFAFSPFAFSPFAFSADDYASAQIRSVVAIAAESGTATERSALQTWSNTGDYYVRVAGKDGASDDLNEFYLEVRKQAGGCTDVMPVGPAALAALENVSAANLGARTLILYDSNRLFTDGFTDSAPLRAKLDELAARPEVDGVVVDLGTLPTIQLLHSQADDEFTCPYAENLTAEAIKRVIDGFRRDNPLEYIVLAGGDGQIPFFRYPDETPLGRESNYDPPMDDFTQAQAALRLDYTLGQDEYGASVAISQKNGKIPVPDLAVGRLVESPDEIINLIDAYLSTPEGITDPIVNTLSTGYDFMDDVSTAIQNEFVLGTGGGLNDTLIAASNLSPDDPASWTADDLRAKLFGNDWDMVFLAGHFNAVSALAADFKTAVSTTQLLDSFVDLTNTLVFSNGCHSGYNIVNPEIKSGVTLPLDWAQAFTRKGATLIAGTGYQYGDTELIEYGERLYLNFARELRTGPAPVPIGKALVRAKLAYLTNTQDNKPLHAKTVQMTTIFGLPMLRINMTGARIPETSLSTISSPSLVTGDPGQTLGLLADDVTRNYGPGDLTEETVTLQELDGDTTITTVSASYLSGPDGVSVQVGEPILPVDRENVAAPGYSLRGIGYRGGSFADTPNVTPLDGAATFELRSPHTRFASLEFYPAQMAVANYFGALGGTGETLINFTPVQHRVENIGDDAIRRVFSTLNYRLFYSNNTQVYTTATGGSNRPALAAAPSISDIRVRANGANAEFRASVVGDPSAGIQEVWITYTDTSSGMVLPIDLTQDPDDSRVWTGVLPGGASMTNLDVQFHAVNGVGLVTTVDNFLRNYQVASGDGDPANRTDTFLTLQGSIPTSGLSGNVLPVSARLCEDDPCTVAVIDETVVFKLGTSERSARTDTNGIASVLLPVNAVPSEAPYPLTASFRGTSALKSSSDERPFLIEKADSQISLEQIDPVVKVDGVSPGLRAVLTADNAAQTPLQRRTVYFTISGTPDGDLTIPEETDFQGRAVLRDLALPADTYPVEVRFLGVIPDVLEEITDSVYGPASASTTIDLPNGKKCPKGNSSKNAKITNFCYVTGNLNGNVVAITDGTLIVGDGAEINGNVDQKKAGGIRILEGAVVKGNVTDKDIGDIIVEGQVDGNVEDKADGDVIIETTGLVKGNVTEKGDGSIFVKGRINGDAQEKGFGSIFVDGQVGGNADEKGSGEVVMGPTGCTNC